MLEVEALRLAHQAIAGCLPKHRTVRILEAGGGSYTLIKTKLPQHVTVVDISPEQLERNTYADAKILGDINDENLMSAEYDMIVCWDVLEHLPDPGAAFTNLTKGLADGGLLVIGCPNLYSFKGLVTRFTPHWFHVQYYRHIRNEKMAGQPGHTPFPTYLHRDMTLDRLVRLGRSLGLTAEVATLYHGPALDDLKASHPKLFNMYSWPVRLARTLSASHVDLDNTEYVAVFRKAGQPEMRQAAA